MRELVVELTNRCNNNCIHCSSRLYEGVEYDLDWLTLARILEVFSKDKSRELIFSGGEPVLSPVYQKAVALAKYLGYKIKLYTSGSYPENFYNADFFRTAFEDIDCIVLSCFSDKEGIHNRICGSDTAYFRFQKSLSLFLDNEKNVEINFIPMALNASDLSGIVSLYSNVVSRINVLKLVKQGAAADNWSEIKCTKKDLTLAFGRERTWENVKIGSSFGEFSTSSTACTAGSSKICVTFDGYLIPCEVFKRNRASFPCILGCTGAEIESYVKTFLACPRIDAGLDGGCRSREISAYFASEGLQNETGR